MDKLSACRVENGFNQLCILQRANNPKQIHHSRNQISKNKSCNEKWSTDLNRQFSMEETRASEKNLKKCSTSFAKREVQIMTTSRFYLIPIRMTKIIKTGNSSCWWGSGLRGALIHCWCECKHVQPLLKSLCRLIRNMGIIYLKIQLVAYTKRMLHPIIVTSDQPCLLLFFPW